MPFAPDPLTRRLLAGLAIVLSLALAASPAPASAQSAFALPDLKLSAGGGAVLAIARQPDGRILIGGDFSLVSGEPRRGLARLLADGTLDTTWNPGTDGIVRAIAVSGSTIHVGGDFATLGGAPRANVGAVSDTGTVTAWNPGADSTVFALAVDGTDVVAGGAFSQVGGENRSRLARITSAGTVTAWAPEPDGTVTALAPGPAAMIVGGQFTTIGGATRRGVALVDAAGLATAWDAGVNGNVSSIAQDGDTAWLAGSFGAPRAGLAGVSLTTGAALAFDAQVGGGALAVAVSGGVVYLGGGYFEAGGTPRNCFGAFDAASGALTAWYPDAGDTCEGGALAVAGTDVLVGGTFERLGNAPALGFGLVSAAGVTAAARSTVGRSAARVNAIVRLSDGRLVVGGSFLASGSSPRANLLRVLADGTLDPAFDPGADAEVLALAAVGSTIYAGGSFTRIAGTARPFAGAVDGDGGFLPWTPPVTGTVRAIATAPGKVYLGGDAGAGASPGSTLGRVDASTGAPDPWNPGVAVTVRAIAIGARVYAGGDFTDANGEPRSRAAAFDLVTAAVTPWAPEPSGRVRSIVVDGARVYLGGDFALPRPALAAVDATTGALQPWNPAASGSVISMSLGGTVLYTIGGYGPASTPPRNGLVAFDTLADTGNVLAWNPAVSGGTINTIVAGPSALYVGGSFTSLGGASRLGLGALPLSGAPSPPSRLAILSVNAGQPVLRDTNFAIVVQSQDAAGNPAAVATDTTLAFTVASGTGALLAGVPCTVLAGQNTCAYTTRYDVAQAGVTVTASVASGDALTAATSGAFTVFGPSNVAFTLASSGIFVNGATSATITVTGASPTGTVTVRANGAPVGSCTAVALVAGAATCTVSGLAAGLYNMDATYSGDAVNAPAATPFDLSLTVAPLPLLQVAKAGTGSGTVTSNTGGIDCGATCQGTFDPGTIVTLTAAAAPGSVHAGWSGGGCAAAGPCAVTMNAAVNVTARFELASVGLTVTFGGTGTGSVASSPAGLDCAATCTAPFVGSTVVTLSATPSSSSTFAGWSGEGCSGTGTCVVTMDTVRNVQAAFVLASRSLTVALAGTGSGRVDSSDGGISCGSDCAGSYTHGTAVTLTPSAFAGSVFAGWSGACSGTGACGVTMDGAKSVTATFSPEDIVSHPLTVAKAGGGGGVVTSTPGGIDCGSTCSASFTSDTIVALGAAPSADSFFAGWSGACTGTGACNVTMDAAKSVTATFKLNSTIPRLANISTRMQVLTGADVLIGGFIIGGTQPKTVVVRARGPSLVPLGVPNALANPVLQLFSGATQIDANDNWQQAANAATIQSSGFAPSDPLESAIYTTLNPGAYTAIVTGANLGTGVAIIEVFEVDKPEVPLLNIATRGKVLTGGDVMIGGFIIQGDAPQTVVVRARGPSLTAAGVPGALQDTVLQLFSGPTVIASNDDWQTSPDAGAIQTAGFAPSDTRESVIRITLNPGAYTAIVTGKNGTTGVGIIEVFAQ